MTDIVIRHDETSDLFTLDRETLLALALFAPFGSNAIGVAIGAIDQEKFEAAAREWIVRVGAPKALASCHRVGASMPLVASLLGLGEGVEWWKKNP